MRNGIVRSLALTGLAVAVIVQVFSAAAATDTEIRFQKLASLYEAKDEKDAYRANLVENVIEEDPAVLWVRLREEPDPLERGAVGLKLLEMLGGPAAWGDASGFLGGGNAPPRQLAALQAGLVAAAALPQTGDPRAAWVARDVFLELKESSQWRILLELTGPPGYYEQMNETFSFVSNLPDILGVVPFPWGDWENRILPLELPLFAGEGDPVSWRSAENGNMILFDDEGVMVTEIQDAYRAWDWKNDAKLHQLIGVKTPPGGGGGEEDGA
ncbi:MAG: hypothetical protein U9R40_07235 [Synergistota bacterium]|nr:hypothetical protein [Synergistota bacterium]